MLIKILVFCKLIVFFSIIVFIHIPDIFFLFQEYNYTIALT